MPKLTPRSYEDALDDLVIGQIDASVEKYLSDQGGPAGTRQPSEAEQTRRWGLADTTVDRAALAARLLAGGLAPEEAEQLEIVRQVPELAAAYTQPVDSQTADVLARLAAYPFRPSLYLHLDPDDRVKEADRLERLWERSVGEKEGDLS